MLNIKILRKLPIIGFRHYNKFSPKNQGIKTFINKINLYTSTSIMFTIGSSLSVYKIPGILDHSHLICDTGVLGTAFGFFLINFSGYKIYINSLNYYKKESYKFENSILRKISYMSVVSGMSLIIFPYFEYGPKLFIPSIISTSFIFLGAKFYGDKSFELKYLDPIIPNYFLSIISLFYLGQLSKILCFPCEFYNFTYSIYLYTALPFFSLAISYRINEAKNLFKKKLPDYLLCSHKLYFCFINIYIINSEIILQIYKHYHFI